MGAGPAVAGSQVNLDEIFLAAQGISGLTRERVAGLMGVPPSLLSQQLNRRGHLSFGRLLDMWHAPDKEDRRVGRQFLRAVFSVTSERLGLIGGMDIFTNAALTVAMTLFQMHRQTQSRPEADEHEKGMA